MKKFGLLSKQLTPVDLFSLDSIGYNYTTYGLEYGLFTQCNSLSDKYEFGYNGQMKMNEIAGIGNHNSALFWEYSPQIGRRWNRDPIEKGWESSYAAFSNNPVYYSDILGNISVPSPTTSSSDQCSDECSDQDGEGNKDKEDKKEEDKKKKEEETPNSGSSATGSNSGNADDKNNSNNSIDKKIGLSATMDNVGIGIGLADYTREGMGRLIKQPGTIKFFSSATQSTAAETISDFRLLKPTYSAAGKLFFWAGMGISFSQGVYNLYNGNYTGATKNGADMGVGAFGLINPATATFGIMYFGIDAFYPGGWPKAMEMNNNLRIKNEKIIPGFNLFRDYP